MAVVQSGSRSPRLQTPPSPRHFPLVSGVPAAASRPCDGAHAGTRVPEICLIKLPADRSVWICSIWRGLCGLDLSPAAPQRTASAEGGGILMSRFGLLFGTRLGAKAPLILNILLTRLFILKHVCRVSPVILVSRFTTSPTPPTPPTLCPAPPPPLLSWRPRLAFLQSSDGSRDGGMIDRSG